MHKKTIAIDFDGVIHKYSRGWADGSIYDEPFEGVFEAIRELMKEHTVFIFSTRSPLQIKLWLNNHLYWHDFPDGDLMLSYGYTCAIIPFWKKFWNKPNILGITKRKLPATIYIDDRAFLFSGDWKMTMKLLSRKI